MTPSPTSGPRLALTVLAGLLSAACVDTGVAPTLSGTPGVAGASVTPATGVAADFTPSPGAVVAGPTPMSQCNSTAQAGADDFRAQVQIKVQPNSLGLGDLVIGCGAEVTAGKTASVQYTGWLLNGTKFDSSRDRGQPFDVQNVGQASVIAAWNQGLIGMRAGGKRRLIVPSALGYGPQGRDPIPGGAGMVFDIEVLSVT